MTMGVMMITVGPRALVIAYCYEAIRSYFRTSSLAFKIPRVPISDGSKPDEMGATIVIY